MKWVILVLCLAPTLYEAWSDKSGESRENKIWDTVLLVVFSVSLAFGAWWLGYRPLPVIGLILGTRIALFDYITNAFLKRYSENHPNINIWSYTGKSTHWHDQLAAKVNWVLRLAVRVVILTIAVWWYFIPIGRP